MKTGPCQPPYVLLASGKASKPSRPPRIAPVVATYSSLRPGRATPVIQSIAWSGPATNPSSDIVKCQSTLPPAVCGRVSPTAAVGARSSSLAMLGPLPAFDALGLR